MWQKWRTFVFGVTAPRSRSREVGLARRRHRERDLLQRRCRRAARAAPTCRACAGSPGWSSRPRRPAFRSSPSCAICSASLALRVMASSSVSQPNSRGQPRAHRLDVRLEHLPHVVRPAPGSRCRGSASYASCTTRGLGQHAAVVQVDEGAVERERLLDLAPEVLVRRHVFGGAARDHLGGARDARQQVGRPIATSAAVPVARCRNARRLDIDMRRILTPPRARTE